MLCILAAIGAFGCYTPVFFLVIFSLTSSYYIFFLIHFHFFHLQSFYGYHDGYDMQDLVLLQTFLGLSLAVGIVASGSSINKTCQVANSRKIRISRQYVCQGCVILVSISIVIFSMHSTGYHTLCLVTWVYGLGLGGYRCENEDCWREKMIYWLFFTSVDSLKMLALERVRGKFFTRAWGEFLKRFSTIYAFSHLNIFLTFSYQVLSRELNQFRF